LTGFWAASASNGNRSVGRSNGKSNGKNNGKNKQRQSIGRYALRASRRPSAERCWSAGRVDAWAKGHA
jgi:hypothetical protein